MLRQLLRKLNRDTSGKSKVAWGIFIAVAFFIAIDSSGTIIRLYEKDFEKEFSYPIATHDFREIVTEFKQKGYSSSVPAINDIYSSIKFNVMANEGCDNNLLLILVKSAPDYLERRSAIRSTWGNKHYLANVSKMIEHKLKVNSIKLVFFIGSRLPEDFELEAALENESLLHKDIVRPDFADSYDNTTLKTMCAMHWAVEFCPDFKFALFADDDMFININNLVQFLQSPDMYPEVKEPKVKSSFPETLYAGKVISTSPVRNKLGKWYLSLEEYPYNYFPPYIPAGAIVMSKSVLEDMYYASRVTQFFRFDDVFLGIIAYKLNIVPFDSPYFFVCHSSDGSCTSDQSEDIFMRLWNLNGASESSIVINDYIIAKHGLSTEELLKWWQDSSLDAVETHWTSEI